MVWAAYSRQKIVGQGWPRAWWAVKWGEIRLRINFSGLDISHMPLGTPREKIEQERRKLEQMLREKL